MAYIDPPKKDDWGSKIEPWHKMAADHLILLFKPNGIQTPLRLLDVGCGKCHVLNYISTKINDFLKVNVDCYGIDVISEFKYECEKFGFKFYSIDVSNDRLPFPNNYFDIVLAFEVIEHLLIPENMLQEVHRVLKANGIFVLSTPNLRWWANIILLILGYQPFIPDTGFYRNYGTFSMTTPSGHVRGYVVRGLKELLETHGFKVINIFGSIHPYKSGGSIRKDIIKVIDRVITLLVPSLSYDLLVFARKT